MKVKNIIDKRSLAISLIKLIARINIIKKTIKKSIDKKIIAIERAKDKSFKIKIIIKKSIIKDRKYIIEDKKSIIEDRKRIVKDSLDRIEYILILKIRR